MDERKNYINPLDGRESVPIDDTFLPERKWQDVDVGNCWLDQTERYTAPDYTLEYKGVPFAPLGGIHGLTGQPGNGKTFTFTQIMIAIMRGEFGELKYRLAHKIPKPRVLYIDTEMEKGNTQLVMLRVYDMMGWERYEEQDQFRILWLREVTNAEMRWRMVLKAICEMKPTVAFIDGMLDVIGDFNNNVDCQEIIYECMATASHYGISLWCLLHENPGSQKMAGHLGSFLERKATDVLRCKKNKEGDVVSFSVSQSKARGRDLADWTFAVEDDNEHRGTPVMVDNEPKVVHEPKVFHFEIEQVEWWVSMLKDAIIWPAKISEIKDALKHVSGQNDNNALSMIIAMAKNRRFIIEQPKSKWEKGQNYPKWEYNVDTF